jgi:hypothetical protein
MSKKDSKMGRPKVEHENQLKPRFTLNISDIDFERFKVAVRKSKMKRSEFARKAILNAINETLSNEN